MSHSITTYVWRSLVDNVTMEQWLQQEEAQSSDTPAAYEGRAYEGENSRQQTMSFVAERWQYPLC